MTDHPGPPAVRIGNAERDATEARLHRAVGAGQLTLDEFSQRLTAVLAARVQADLDAVVADLPALSAAPAATRARGPVRRWLVAVMGADEARGRWRPAPHTTAIAVMGGVDVDLRDAEVDPDGFTLSTVAVMGGVDVIVPDGMAVEVGGFAIMGAREVSAVQPADPDAPVIRIQAYALMGGVEIRNPTDKENRRSAKRAARLPAEAATVRQGAPRRGSTALERAPGRTLERRGGGGSWLGRAVAAVAVAAVTSPFWLPGEAAVAAFASNTHVVTDAAVERDETVNAATAFGSVTVVVPDGVQVELESGTVVFGSSDCEACEVEPLRGAPAVRVRRYGAFGSVNVLTETQAQERDARNAEEDALERAEEAREDALERADEARGDALERAEDDDG